MALTKQDVALLGSLFKEQLDGLREEMRAEMRAEMGSSKAAGKPKPKPTQIELGDYKGSLTLDFTGDFGPYSIGLKKVQRIVDNLDRVKALLVMAEKIENA